MPRQPASASAAAFPTSTGTARLKPPDDLDPPERALFLEIVLSVRPDHFEPADAVLLASYCRACVLEKVASAELARAGFVDTENGRPSPWHLILTQAARSQTTLSRILRLNPQSRGALVTKEQHVSYYEKMALEGRRDGQN